MNGTKVPTPVLAQSLGVGVYTLCGISCEYAFPRPTWERGKLPAPEPIALFILFFYGNGISGVTPRTSLYLMQQTIRYKL